MYNVINEVTVNANWLRTPITTVPGQLTLGNRGVEFSPNKGTKVVQIDYAQISRVWVQLRFNRWPHGLTVELTTGERYQWVSWRASKVVHVFNRKLAVGIVRHQR